MQIDEFNEYNAEWSDWNGLGGRWSDVIPGSVLRYSDNPELFMQTVERFDEFYHKEQQEAVDKFGDLTVRQLLTDKRFHSLYRDRDELNQDTETATVADSDLLAIWQVQRALRAFIGYFGFDQSFFDIANHTNRTSNMKRRIQENPDKQFIVVWDYHH